MSEPRTETGKLLLISELTFHSGRRLADNPELILAIEAEAVPGPPGRATSSVSAAVDGSRGPRGVGTMSDDLRAALEAKHVVRPVPSGLGPDARWASPECNACGQGWPCDVRVLLDAALATSDGLDTCATCGGSGWTTELDADPLPSGEPGEPYQVQVSCSGCGGIAVGLRSTPEAE